MEGEGEIEPTWGSGKVFRKEIQQRQQQRPPAVKEIHSIVSVQEEALNSLNRGTISRYCKGNRAIEDLMVDIYILEPNL